MQYINNLGKFQSFRAMTAFVNFISRLLVASNHMIKFDTVECCLVYVDDNTKNTFIGFEHCILIKFKIF